MSLTVKHVNKLLIKNHDLQLADFHSLSRNHNSGFVLILLHQLHIFGTGNQEANKLIPRQSNYKNEHKWYVRQPQQYNIIRLKDPSHPQCFACIE